MLKKVPCPVAATATTCPPQVCQKPKAYFACMDAKENSNRMLEANFPQNDFRSTKDVCSSPCKGIYTWISSPKALYNNRKLTHTATAAATISHFRWVHPVLSSIFLFCW